MTLKPAIICLSPSGLGIAKQAAQTLNGTLYIKDNISDTDSKTTIPFHQTLPTVRELFLSGSPLIGVCAAAILIRALAPVLNTKQNEPPVIAIAEDSSSVVPLLGGHHGANTIARKLAAELSSTAAITTAGDLHFGIALDDPPPGWQINSPEKAKSVMARMLQGQKIHLTGEETHKATWLEALPKGNEIKLTATLSAKTPESDLIFYPKRATLGVGCSRNCPPAELDDLIQDTLSKVDISPKALAGIFSIDLKADEPAILQLSQNLKCPLRFFSANELEQETPRLVTPSDIVFAEVGCHGVSEAAALAAAGSNSELKVTKRKTANATCAIALSDHPIKTLKGQKRGSVMLISTGPGKAPWRTPEASQWVAKADQLVGYGFYIDLLDPIATHKPRKEFPLGGEEDRCRYALEKAGDGHDIGLVCSGDAGIYAMASLVYELLDRPKEQGGVSDKAKRVEVIVTPGISAFQAAASLSGAPIGHDFCTISLSDLLTPRDTIVQRLKAAAQGDFVIALYNPASKKRRDLLKIACEIIQKHRPAKTPIMLGTNLGRETERIKICALKCLQTEQVDMFTVILIGSSQTKVLNTPDGPRLFTPRGYENTINTKKHEETK
ncbi:MAG: precorrin-3B C(17)-methyltransferase [Pseudomonadota bacterium]